MRQRDRALGRWPALGRACGDRLRRRLGGKETDYCCDRDLSPLRKRLDKKSRLGGADFDISLAGFHFGEQGVSFDFFTMCHEPPDQGHGLVVDVVALQHNRNITRHRNSSNVSWTIRSTPGRRLISRGLAEGMCSGWEYTRRIASEWSVS